MYVCYITRKFMPVLMLCRFVEERIRFARLGTGDRKVPAPQIAILGLTLTSTLNHGMCAFSNRADKMKFRIFTCTGPIEFRRAVFYGYPIPIAFERLRAIA